MEATRGDMEFIVELAVRYHRRRASFLEMASSTMMLVTVIGGAGAFLSLLGDRTAVAKVATLVVTVVGTIQALFRVDTCAAQHRQWLKLWMEMLFEVRVEANPSVEQLAGWMKRRYAIESECIGEMRALQVDCLHRAANALNRDAGENPVRPWHRALLQVWPFEGSFPRG